MRDVVRGSRLLLVPLAVLAVMILPGTTSTSYAPALLPSQRVEAAVAVPTPILLPVSLPTLLRAAIPPASDPSEVPAAALDAAGDGRAQVVSVYGYPGVCSMGELGCHGPAGAVARARELAAALDEANGDRDAIPALHLVAAVAQPYPGPDGSYLAWMDDETIREWVEVARRERVLLFLDVQIGWADPLASVRRLAWALEEPFVHLALDPEFATRGRGLPPGEAIGTLGAADVNAVQAYLAGLVEERALPRKMLVLHQFLPTMLTEKPLYEQHAEVDVTVDMDGYGAPEVKLGGYEAYARTDAEYSALKLFFHWDAPLITPAEMQALSHPPDYVIYQ